MTKGLIPLATRLWAKVEVHDGEGCWLWTGHIDSKTGYGQIGLGRKSQGIDSTHRVSYLLTQGEVPPGLSVLHKCDNRACVRPSHLFLGTHVDNMQDMKNKGRGRGAEGLRNANAKLTWDQVDEIRARYERDRNPTAIAADFGITPQYVWQLHRRLWRRKS